MQNGPNSPAGATAEWQPPNSADGPDQPVLSRQEATDTTGVTRSCRTTRTGTQIPHTTYSLSDSLNSVNREHSKYKNHEKNISITKNNNSTKLKM